MNLKGLYKESESVSIFIRSENNGQEHTKSIKNNAYELDKSLPEKFSFTNSTTQSNNLNHLNQNLFTFKPKMNAKSNLIAQKLLSFAERQDQHTRKQMKLVYIIQFKKKGKHFFNLMIIFSRWMKRLNCQQIITANSYMPAITVQAMKRIISTSFFNTRKK
jgi:hypothetical protein